MKNILKSFKETTKNSEKERITFISYLVMFITYSIVGYVGDIDVLKVFTFVDTSQIRGSEISLVAVFLPLLNAYLIWYFYNKWR